MLGIRRESEGEAAMSEYELIVRGGEVVTAADKFRADVGVRGGKIVAIADRLTDGARVIDASGLLVMPGGIDSHVHLAQNAFGGPKMADGFETGTRSAIAGGNTTVLPFALQPRGASLRASVMAYHKEADGNSYCDYGFHLIVTDPTPSVLGQELPALVADGYSSFKVFMTYDDMVLNDRQLLEVFDCARGCGALVMVHCEGYDAIKFMTQRLEAAGKTAPYYHAVSRPEVVEREATHRAISHGELLDTPIMIVHVSGREAMEQIRWAQRRGLKVYGETCTQYIVVDRRRPQGPQHGRERRQIRLLAAAARPRLVGGDLGRHPHRRVPDLLLRPLPVLLRGLGGQAEPEGAHLVQVGAERHPRRRSCGCRSSIPKGVVEGRITVNEFVALDVDQPRQDVRPLSAQRRDRASASTPTSCCGTPTSARRSARSSCTTAPTTRPMRAWRSPAGR